MNTNPSNHKSAAGRVESDDVESVMDEMKDMTTVIRGCVDCNLCVKECAFLHRYGTPGAICRQHMAAPSSSSFVFACNLCGLCSAVCPKGLDVAGAFLEIRTRFQQHGGRTPVTAPVDKRHTRICNYAHYGASPLLSLHQVPAGAKTVFFPGCTLAGTRAAVTLRTYRHLQTIDPDCGIVLDCCGKPSRDLGITDGFKKSFSRLAENLQKSGVQTILTACPSCYVTFREYLPACATRTVYEAFAENPPPLTGQCAEDVAVQDACTTRDVSRIHGAVRTLVASTGAGIREMKHNRRKTLCCGDGAAAAFIAPELTEKWQAMRQEEAGGRRVITYCAGCSGALGGSLRTTHLLDLLFDHESALAGREQKTRSPFTYLNRLLLKWRLILNSFRRRHIGEDEKVR